MTGTLVVITTELNEWQEMRCGEQSRLLGNVVSLKKTDLVFRPSILLKIEWLLKSRKKKKNKTYFFLNEACVYLHFRKLAFIEQLMVLMAFKVSLGVDTGERHDVVFL